MVEMRLKSKIEVFLRGFKQKKAALIDGFFHNVLNPSTIDHARAFDSENKQTKSLSKPLLLQV